MATTQTGTSVPKLKQVVKIKDARIAGYFGKKVLFGCPEDHPRQYLNGKDVHTSEILSMQGDRVETLNTVYMVQNWVNLVGFR
jgi:hypothetical protein